MVIMPVSSRTYQMLVQNDSAITCMEDLSGKHLGIGEAGSGNAVTIQKVLTTFGLEEGDYTASAIGPTEALSALQNKQLDWTLLLASFPVGSVNEALTTGYARLMSLSEEEQAKLLETYPFMAARTIPAGTYPSQDEDILAVGHYSYIAATSAMDEETIYEFTMAVYSNLGEVFSYCSTLEKDDSFLNPIETIAALTAKGVKLHPGAEKAFKELGYM